MNRCPQVQQENPSPGSALVAIDKLDTEVASL